LDQYLKSPTWHFRPLIKTSLITSAGYNFKTAEFAVTEGFADLVAFGKDFISNPDLVLRYEHNETLNPYNTQTFYGGDHKGFTDYPFINEG